MNFRLFLEEARPTISYDFDGVLHTSMIPGTIHPINFYDWRSWEPYKAMHSQLRKDAQLADIIVVSSRCPDNEDVMWQFIRTHQLPVEDVYCTCMKPKIDYLKNAGAIKHYDDDPKMERELQGSGIEFVLINHI